MIQKVSVTLVPQRGTATSHSDYLRQPPLRPAAPDLVMPDPAGGPSAKIILSHPYTGEQVPFPRPAVLHPNAHIVAAPLQPTCVEFRRALRRLRKLDRLLIDAAAEWDMPLEKAVLLDDLATLAESSRLAFWAFARQNSLTFPEVVTFDLVNLLEAGTRDFQRKEVALQSIGNLGLKVKDAVILRGDRFFEVSGDPCKNSLENEVSSVRIPINCRVGECVSAGSYDAMLCLMLTVQPMTSASGASTAAATTSPRVSILLTIRLSIRCIDRISPLTVLATKFVPAWMQELASRSISPTQVKQAPSAPGLDCHKWMRQNMPDMPRDKVARLASLPDIPAFHRETSLATRLLPLHPETYAFRFDLLSRLEGKQLEEKYADFTLYDTALTAQGPRTYIIKVPGIQDGNPPLRPGDPVHVRTFPGNVGHQNFELLMTQVREYRGWVHNVVRIKGQALVSLSGKIPPNAPVVISFPAPMNQAAHVRKTLLDLDSDEDERAGRSSMLDCLQSFLFPTEADCNVLDINTPLGDPQLTLDFFNDILNGEQKMAVERLARRDYGDVPFIIHGGPGTGKTSTLTECCLQVLKADPTAHLLVSAPSNSACDTITRRLSAYLDNNALVRINHPAHRLLEEIPSPLLPFCHIENGSFAIPSLTSLMRYRVIVVTCADAALLRSVGLANRDLREHVQPDRVLSPSDPPFFFSHLLIDEAGQATELDTILPISLLTDALPTITRRAKLVLCGDPCQLGPVVASPDARANGLHVSLMERLISSLKMYQPFSSSGRLDLRIARDGEKDPRVVQRGRRVRPTLCDLSANYRSHPDMLTVPSRLFYDDRLRAVAGRSTTHAVLDSGWDGLPNPECPMMMVDVGGQADAVAEVVEGDGVSGWWNVREAREVSRIIRNLVVERKVVNRKEVGVMAPFREQVKRIRAKLRQMDLAQVNVGTVEDYQGQEYKVVIISTVRARAGTVLTQDLASDVGLIGFPKRFNVAVTRAQALLCVVGSKATLSDNDANWQEWIAEVQKRGGVVGPGGAGRGEAHETGSRKVVLPTFFGHVGSDIGEELGGVSDEELRLDDEIDVL
ncbi:hypothetical protein HKX48_004856 [Thoreauomyces humboldtii]|nr:hypothetical protein HKX48_004856 [Thoreauomyces humboldtii]